MDQADARYVGVDTQDPVKVARAMISLLKPHSATTPPLPIRGGTVYVVGFANYVKIGFSVDFLGRLKALQEGTPEVLVVYAKLPGTMADERALHKRFVQCRLRGEWFRKEGALADWIEAGCKA